MNSSSQSERWEHFIRSQQGIPNTIPNDWIDVYRDTYHDWLINDNAETHGPRDDNRAILDRLIDEEGVLRGRVLTNHRDFAKWHDDLIKYSEARTDKKPLQAEYIDEFINPHQQTVPLAQEITPVSAVSLPDAEQHISLTGFDTFNERNRNRLLDISVNPPQRNIEFRRFANLMMSERSDSNDNVTFFPRRRN